MNHLTLDNFKEFFEDIHGYKPYAWQTRLMQQILSTGKWPDVIKIPTGQGKTAVLDLFVFALAANPDASPRRLFFVIDRRIIVDQIYQRAFHIRQKLLDSSNPIVRRVTNSLENLIADVHADLNLQTPLGISQLRGGMPPDRAWAERPDMPWISVSTVDQLGSALLFRSYRGSRSSSPIQAALIRCDSLIVLDEVHIAEPIRQTLKRVLSLKEKGYSSQLLPTDKTQLVSMSATPENSEQDMETDVFELSDADKQEPDLKNIHNAHKRAKAIVITPNNTVESIPNWIKTKFLGKGQISEINQQSVVGIVVNQVATAHKVHKMLIEAGHQSYLVTGRMRSIDKENILKQFLPFVNPDPNSREIPNKTVFVTSTQAIEIGADWSFDHMITECAPVDSLAQRFGRVNRRGLQPKSGLDSAKIWILGVKSSDDPVYKQSTGKTWSVLLDIQAKKKKNRKTSDFLLDASSGSKDIDISRFPPDSYSPKINAAMLLDPHLDALVQTSSPPTKGDHIGEYIKGINNDASPDITLVFRHDRTTDALRTVPPRAAEFLSVPLYAAKRLLRNIKSPNEAISDINSYDHEEETQWNRDRSRYDGICEIWKSWPHNKVQRVKISTLSAGDIVLVDPKIGGLSWNNFDPKSQQEASDIGDEAQFAYGGKITLRLDERIFPYIRGLQHKTEKELLHTIKEHSRTSSTIRAIIDQLEHDQYDVLDMSTDSANYRVLRSRNKMHTLNEDTQLFDASEESLTETGAATTLKDHGYGVGGTALEFAKALGFSEDIQAAFSLYGILHDIGKIDTRFQEKLAHGNLALLSDTGFLAKSVIQGIKYTPIEPETEYPLDMRHEYASAALVASNPNILENIEDPELVLWLIMQHHGNARALPKIISDPNPQILKYEHDGNAMETDTDLSKTDLASKSAEWFCRLNQKYGIYGLALLEAVSRLADHRQSEAEAKGLV